MPLATPQIITGSVFAPPDEPLPRLLVTRHWPRGIAKGAVDQWEPNLAPAPALAEALAAGTLSTDAFAEAYRVQLLARPSLLDWAGRMAANTGVALLCTAEAGADCHCALLAAIVRERLGAWARIAATCSSTTFSIVQVGRQPAASSRNFFRTA